MITTQEIVTIHNLLIANFGGAHGVRDMAALESAIPRPFQTYDNNDLYPGPLEKATALIESLLINHPFVDGNKRTGYTALRLFLMQHGLDISSSQDDRYNFVIGVASGGLQLEEIVSWLRVNTKPWSDPEH